MAFGYATEPTRLAIIGGEARRFITFAEHLIDEGHSVVIVDDPAHLDDVPITSLIIAETFRPGMNWEQWWRRANATSTVLSAIFPHLATLSTAVFVAFVSSDDVRERDAVRDALGSILSAVESEAAMISAIDFTVNGVEVPRSADRAILYRRLKEFVMRRSSISSGSVLPVEVLSDQTIAAALSEISL